MVYSLNSIHASQRLLGVERPPPRQCGSVVQHTCRPSRSLTLRPLEHASSSKPHGFCRRKVPADLYQRSVNLSKHMSFCSYISSKVRGMKQKARHNCPAPLTWHSLLTFYSRSSRTVLFLSCRSFIFARCLFFCFLRCMSSKSLAYSRKVASWTPTSQSILHVRQAESIVQLGEVWAMSRRRSYRIVSEH